MNPSEFFIKQLEDKDIDELEYVVVLRKHKDGCISYSSSGGDRVDIYAICEATKVYLLADIIKSDIKEIL